MKANRPFLQYFRSVVRFVWPICAVLALAIALIEVCWHGLIPLTALLMLANAFFGLFGMMLGFATIGWLIAKGIALVVAHANRRY